MEKRENHSHVIVVLRGLLTVVVRRVLERRTRIVDQGEIWQHVASPSAEHGPSGGNQQDPRQHREDLVSGGMQRQYYDSAQRVSGAAVRPLSQILHQEERVEDVHPSGRLVQHDDVRVEQQVTSNVQSSPFRDRHRFDFRVPHLLQSQILDQDVNLQTKVLSRGGTRLHRYPPYPWHRFLSSLTYRWAS
jgi:hypothetical protein